MTFAQERKELLSKITGDEWAILEIHNRVLRDIYGKTGNDWTNYFFIRTLREARGQG